MRTFEDDAKGTFSNLLADLVVDAYDCGIAGGRRVSRH